MKRQPSHGLLKRGRVFAGASLLGIAFLGFTACLGPDQEGPGTNDPSGQDLEDPALLAGASSSTNWPVKTGINFPVEITGTSDSALVLRFLRLDSASLVQHPVEVSGTLALITGTAIPALHPVREIRRSFSPTDTLEVPPELFDSVGVTGQDSVFFTLKIEIDTFRCVLIGFGYSKSSGRFFKSPFSANSISSIQLEAAQYSFEGELDTSTLPEGLRLGPEVEASFYILGTSYCWKTSSSKRFLIGPVPSGNYPLQLIVLAPPISGSSRRNADIYEVVLQRRTLPGPGLQYAWVFSIGAKLLTRELDGIISLLPALP